MRTRLWGHTVHARVCVSRDIKTMNLFSSIQSTTCTFGQWLMPCTVSWLSCLSSANVCWNISAALRLLRQGGLLWSSSSDICGGSLEHWTTDHGIAVRLLVHPQLTHDAESSVNMGDQQRAQVRICRKCPFKMCDYLQATVHFSPSVFGLLVDD